MGVLTAGPDERLDVDVDTLCRVHSAVSNPMRTSVPAGGSAAHHATPVPLVKKVIMAAQALEQSALEQKDKAQLVQIADALGVKTNSRSKKADIIGQILARAGGAAGNGSRPSDPAPATAETSPSGDAAPDAPSAEGSDGGSSEPVSITAPASDWIARS